MLTAWLLATQKPRRPKKLLQKKEAALQELIAKYRGNRKLHARIERLKVQAAQAPPAAKKRAKR